MTCQCCGREVTLLGGGYCGHCSTTISAAINAAVSDLQVLDAEVVDVWRHRDDGYLHVRLDDGADPYLYTSQNGGRSSGKLHVRPDCRHLTNVPEEYIVERKRSEFDSDQAVCGTCGGSA